TLTGLTRFKEKFPEKFLNIGIAEQNMVGIAAGMAKEGKNVFVTTYANFLAMRAYEQIRIQLGYMGFGVKVIGTGSGLAMGMSGNTHYGIEDIALMRAIPGLMVVSPADGTETTKVIREAAEYHGPVYIRLSGTLNNPIVYTEEYLFEFGKAVLLRRGTDISIIATGTMVHESLVAADILEKENGISASVINMHTIKPLDTSIINDICVHSRLAVTVEEHSVIGGLGGAVAEYLSGLSAAPRLMRIGIPDCFQKTGDYQYLLGQNGLTGPQIAEKIMATFHAIVHT
ncbi:MAG: transketolase C-terminal domain-containing protein, partial [Methanoregula sp.]